MLLLLNYFVAIWSGFWLCERPMTLQQNQRDIKNDLSDHLTPTLWRARTLMLIINSAEDQLSDFFFMIIKLELIFMAHLHVLYNNHTWTWTITVVFLEWVWGQIMINIVLADTFIHAAVSLGAVRRSSWPYILHIITSRSIAVKNFYLQKHPQYVCIV